MTKNIIRRETLDDCSPELDELHPLLQRIYSARHIRSMNELDRSLAHLFSYSQMRDIDKAANRLATALEKQERILIIGDFDVDGATSTALGVRALRTMGAQHVSYIVPNRFEFGYGLSPEIIDASDEFGPNLIMTVDNGITSLEGVEHARKKGIDVIITDHHLPGDELPAAAAIINPNRKDGTFPSKNLAGVGVIFYVMVALRATLKDMGWFEAQKLPLPNMARYLDLVALGTVADVVPLDRNNRILVHQGLRRIRAGQACSGILSLLEIGNRKRERITASDLAYVVGPRLNAAGRLTDMSLGVDCLLADEPRNSYRLGRKLDNLNLERRALEARMQGDALDFIKKWKKEDLPRGICVYRKEWGPEDQGIVGLIAAQVKETTGRPVFVFARVDDDTLKGSGRSIKGVHLRNLLEKLAVRNPNLMSKYGGHAMAAGISLPIANYDAFSEAFNELVCETMGQIDISSYIESDGALSPNDFTLEVAELIRNAGPWGQEFPEPLFDGVFGLLEQRVVSDRHLKVSLQLPGSEYTIDGIVFNADLKAWPNERCKHVKIAYRLDVNEYRDRQQLQLVIEALEAHNELVVPA